MISPNHLARYGSHVIDRSRALGSGSYGTVYQGYSITPNGTLSRVAIKEMFYDSSSLNEISVLRTLSHPNIVRFIDYKACGNKLLMVMEYCDSGTLEDALIAHLSQSGLSPSAHKLRGQFPSETFVISLFEQIMRGVRFMHEKGLLHRDLKPSNILMQGSTPKLADLGTTKLQNHSSFKTLVGTPLFSSPEILLICAGEEASYTEKSDVWSLGLILYVMCNYTVASSDKDRLKLSLPWNGKSTKDLLEVIQHQPLKFHNSQLAVPIKNLLRDMLQIDSSKRLSFSELFSRVDSLVDSQADLSDSCLLQYSRCDLLTAPPEERTFANDSVTFAIGEATIQITMVEQSPINPELVAKLLALNDEDAARRTELRQVTDFIRQTMVLVQDSPELHQNIETFLNERLHEVTNESPHIYFQPTAELSDIILSEIQRRICGLGDPKTVRACYCLLMLLSLTESWSSKGAIQYQQFLVRLGHPKNIGVLRGRVNKWLSWLSSKPKNEL